MHLSEAREILGSMTKSASLLRHMRTVQLVMEAYAEKLGEDKNEWSVTGLLHDADYEAFPEQHPGAGSPLSAVKPAFCNFHQCLCRVSKTPP